MPSLPHQTTGDLISATIWNNQVDAINGIPATLLKANSGTSSGTSAAALDSIALSGLTALDSLLVFVSFEAVTQSAQNPRLRNTTDGVDIVSLSHSALGAGNQVDSSHGGQGEARIRQAQSAATKIFGEAEQVDGGAAKQFATNVATFTTAWTGSWTLALYWDGNVSGGGTFRWSWAVYRLAGQ